MIKNVIFNAVKSKGITYGDDIHFRMSSGSGEGDGGRCGLRTVQLPAAFGTGGFQLEQIRPGMSLLIYDFTSTEDVVWPFRIDEKSFVFSTVLSGVTERRSKVRGKNQKNLLVSGPCDMMTKSGECDGEVFIKGGEPVRCVGLHLNLELFKEYLTEVEVRDNKLIDVLNEPEGLREVGRLSQSPQTRLVASQLLSCRLDGLCRKLFVESKALELLSLALSRLDADSSRSAMALSRSDVEKLHEARRTLCRRMEEPPGLQELARLVSLNEFKLKKGFREVFGCTVFGALRTHRMNEARAMLLDSDMTVGTVAAAVGYTNMSHFISAFREQFGVTPGTVLKDSRRSKF